jgi:serine protease Do/serine protease DegQ
MLERVLPAVVNIATTGRVQTQQHPLSRDPFFQHFFNMPERELQEREISALGSGVIIDGAEGYVVTNYHVIENADEINVRLHDGRSFAAEVIGTDPEADIAVIQIPSSDVYGITIGDSESLRVGDFVVAIGNPFGLGQTVTSGIVSAKGRGGRGIAGYEDFIQTDASINVGNSGGALVNLHGELVGINTAIFGGRGGGNVGIGFAIPVHMVMRLTSQIVEYGEVRRGQLGVLVEDLTPDLADARNIDANSGALIKEVVPETAAADAGLREGDVVIAVDGRSINSARDLRNEIGLSRVGEKIELEYLRDGDRLIQEVVIGEMEATISFTDPTSKYLEGATLGESSEDEMGVVVLEVESGSTAWSLGLREKDVIFAINRVRIQSLEDVENAVARNASGLLLHIRRGDMELRLEIR